MLVAQDTRRPVDSASLAQSHQLRRQIVWRDPTTAFVYTRPMPFRAIADAPGALAASARTVLRVDRVPAMLGIAAGTLVLIAADESILDESRRLARRLGLPRNHPSADVRVGAFKLAFPTTIGSGLYFLGDGLTSVAIAAGFAARGSAADDLRARRVASEVVEALLASGAVTQLMKHAAGRQTPSEATAPGGRWRPFAPLGDYNRNVPGYDAFPSGHLASTMATFTVLALNYPENRIIWPIGSVTMGALSFAMINNGVHWASDYPLALAIGGVIGKVVVDRGRSVVPLPRQSTLIPISAQRRPRLEFTPLVSSSVIGLQARF